MTNIVLPTSPNWYLSQISDSNRGGFYVFGARHDVVVFNTSSVPSSPPLYMGSYCGHRDRVTATKLGQTQSQLNLCCSSADDLTVRLWDVKTHVEIQSHNDHKDRPMVISWSQCQRDLIVSGDDRGTIIKWVYTTEERQAIRFEKDCIFSLACCNHNASLLAVGYKSGNVLLVDISTTGRILQRLRGHDEEVHSVLWCPVPGEGVLRDGAYSQTDGESSGYILATGSRDRTIRVWSSSQGRQLQVKKLPQNTGNRRENTDSQGRSKVWTTLYWPLDKPTQLVSSSFGGELIMWDLSQSSHQREVFQPGGCRVHSRIIFNICAGGEEMNTLFTVSMDRMIVLWDLDQLSSIYSMPSLGGHVYKVETSPLDPGRVALGVGDNMIRVWNTNNRANVFDVNTIWQGIKSKVTALCWHPSKEGQLAFGTEDGRVGIYDVMSNKLPNLSSTYHRRTVYGVAFGPASRTNEDESQTSCGVSLYSVGDMTVLEHRPNNLNKHAVNINNVIDTVNGKRATSSQRSDMCFKPDNSVVALASDDGSVEVLQSVTFRLLCCIHVHQKLINCLQWHPQFTADNPLGSECSCWLASAGNDAVIRVVDLSSVLESPKQEVTQMTTSMRKLEGHTIRVTGLVWSPHEEGKMASVGYDGIAYVWNVKSGEATHQFEGHVQRLLCVTWSGTDPDEVMTGGFDSTLIRWNVSSCPKAVIDLGKKKKRKKKAENDMKNRPPTHTMPSSSQGAENMESNGVNAKGDNSMFFERKSQKNISAEGDAIVSKKDDSFVSTDRGQKKTKDKKERDYQDELAELKEMLEMRKLQILKEKQKSEAKQENETSTKESNTEEEKLDHTDTERESHEEPLTEPIDVLDSSETARNILGERYSLPEKQEEATPEETQRKDFKITTRDFPGAARKRKGRVKSVFPVSAKEENRGKVATSEDILLLTKLKVGGKQQIDAFFEKHKDIEEASNGNWRRIKYKVYNEILRRKSKK